MLFPVHPLTLATSRAALTPSRAQDDPPDAALQVALLLKHRDTLTPLAPQSPTLRALAQLVEHRRRVVGDNVPLTHRLTRALKNSFPHVLQWFQDKATPLCGDVLSRWPTRKAAQLARRTTLETFFRDHHVRSAAVITQRLQALKTATPLTPDAGVIAPKALLVQALGAHLRVTLQALADFDTAIAQRAQRHPAFPLFHALPGAGPVGAPRLLVALANNAYALPPLPNGPSLRALHQSPNAAARRPGGPGAARVPRSSDRRASNGPRHRSGRPAGPRSTTSSNATRAKPIRPLCEP